MDGHEVGTICCMSLSHGSIVSERARRKEGRRKGGKEGRREGGAGGRGGAALHHCLQLKKRVNRSKSRRHGPRVGGACRLLWLSDDLLVRCLQYAFMCQADVRLPC